MILCVAVCILCAKCYAWEIVNWKIYNENRDKSQELLFGRIEVLKPKRPLVIPNSLKYQGRTVYISKTVNNEL